MGTAIFIGDELTATGFRLAGIATLVPKPEAAGTAFEEARSRGSLIIMTADVARHIPAPQLEAAMLAETPAVAIVPDVLFSAPPPDLITKLRSILGIEA